MVTSSPSDGMLDLCQWAHHHNRFLRRTGVNGYIITAGSYVGPTSMDASSPPDGTLDRRRWLHYHRCIVRGASGGKTLSLPYGMLDQWW